MTGIEDESRQNTRQKRKVTIAESVSYFTNEAAVTKTRGNIKLQLSLEVIEERAKEHGLSPNVILKLADVAGSARFSEAITIRLIKSLIPSKYIPEEAIIHVVSWMCTNKPSSTVKTWLIKWIITVYDYIGEKNKIHAVYPILFLFIDNEQMCPFVCHLLYLMTRKEDVKQYRVQKLLEIQNKVGTQPHIMGLLSLYKLYSPATITLSTAIGNRPFFHKIHPKWTQSVRDIVEKNRVNNDQITNDMDSLNGFPSEDATSVPAKRLKLDVIPKLQTTTSMNQQAINNKVSMEQMHTFKDLLQNVDRLQLPSQISSILKYPKLYHVVSCLPEQTTHQRLSYWLYEVLCEEIVDYSGVGNNPRAEKLLQYIINYCEFIQEGIPICEQFLTRYLCTWNGMDYRVYILQLITRFRLWPFQKMNDLLLEPIHKLFFSSSVYFKCQVISTYTQLLRNFVCVEWPRYESMHQHRGANIAETTMQLNETCLFNQDYEEFDPVDTISQFISLVDRLCAVGLLTENDNALLMHCTLAFYELVSKMCKFYCFPNTLIPSTGILLKALFGSDASALSRVCNIICNYRTEIKHRKTSDDKAAKFKPEVIQQLNHHILLFSDSLWRNQAFTPTPSVAPLLTFEHKKPAEIDLSNANDSFSLWKHPALASYADSFMFNKQVTDANTSTDRSSLKKEYLEYLKSQHLYGVHWFIKTFIKNV